MVETYRCYICNHVNNPDIQTFPDEYASNRTFGPDPYRSELDVCSECLPIEEEEEDMIYLDYDNIYEDDIRFSYEMKESYE